MLFELPEVLLVEILTLAGLQSAGRVLSSKKLERCHASSLDDLLWSTLVLKRWAIAALPATGNWSWRSFATFLETEVRGLLRRSVKLAVAKLREVARSTRATGTRPRARSSSGCRCASGGASPPSCAPTGRSRAR